MPSKETKEDTGKIQGKPVHIAIIMDGNGRWAAARGLSRSAGHRKGAQTAKEIVAEAVRQEIKVLTLYAFSTENWKRPRREITFLMNLLKVFLLNEIRNMVKNNVKIMFIGRVNEFSAGVLSVINKVRNETASSTGLILNIALNYGSRTEIVEAVRKTVQDCQAGLLQAQKINEQDIGERLYTNGLADPDLIIRTSGEQRLSNFLLWQAAYSEFIFTKVLWPDFTAKDLAWAIEEYSNRKRRFGG